MPRRAPGRSAQLPSSREAELEALLAARERELAERDRLDAERAAREAATGEVLRLIRDAPADLQRVLDAIAQRAARLCGADSASVRRIEGDRLVIAGAFGPASREAWTASQRGSPEVSVT